MGFSVKRESTVTSLPTLPESVSVILTWVCRYDAVEFPLGCSSAFSAVLPRPAVDERADPKTGLSHQNTTKDGKPYIAGLVQRDRSGKPVADAVRFADGSFDEREVKPDGATVVHRYWAPTKTRAYQTTDSHKRVLEAIDDSPGVYIKTTFRYDDVGRQTEIADYDRSGNLLRKVSVEYQDDANGNWIEQKESIWDHTLRNKPPKLGLVTRRTITYY